MRILVFSCIFLFGQINVFGQDYNIVDYGAIADGNTLCTKHIQSAIDEANDSGGGRVIIPAGRFLSGTIVMKSNVDLHLLEGAILLGSTDPNDYIKINRWKGLIMADNQHHIGITGRGEVDGQGRQLALHLDSLFYAGQLDSAHYNFVEMRPKYYLRPQLIEFVECKYIKVRDVTLKNAACWVQTHDKCENVIIDNVRTESDAYWNNDGIDISDCRNVRITNCFVNSADDGICLKSHSREHFCDSIYIANCTIRSSASAIKFGTRSHGGFKNIVIENIKIYDTFRSAIAIESVDGGILENILVQNIHAVNTGNAIFIRLGKRNKTGETASLKNVTLKDIKVEVAFGRPDNAYEIRGPSLPFFHNTFPCVITGIPGHPIEDLVLENIEITYPGKGNKGLAHMPISRLDEVPENISNYPEFSMFRELPAWGLYVRHVDNLTLRNVTLSIVEADYRAPLIFDDVNNLNIDSLLILGENKTHHIILHNVKGFKTNNDTGVLKK